MGKYFVRNTPPARLEQEMMLPPNFIPRGSISAILRGYSPYGADAACQSCPDHHCQSSRTLVCLHITERLQAGAVTIVELAAETVRPWKHLGLKQWAVGIAGWIGGVQFEDQLHIARMLKMTKGEEGLVNSQLLHLEAILYIGVLSCADNIVNGIVLAAFDLDFMFDTEYDSQPHTFYPGRRCLSSMWRLSEE